MKRFLFLLSLVTMIVSSCNVGKISDAEKTQAVLDNIANRKSVRSYTDQAVPDELVEKLLRAAMAAPTAMNTQPWEFVVVNNRDTLDAFAAKLTHAKMLAKAPLAIVVCANTQIVDKDGKVAYNRFWIDDASAATENLLLAAEALGLGAVWTAASDEVRSAIVKEALGIPDEIMPLCVIPIGYPDGENKPKDKWKPEKIHYNKW